MKVLAEHTISDSLLSTRTATLWSGTAPDGAPALIEAPRCMPLPRQLVHMRPPGGLHRAHIVLATQPRRRERPAGGTAAVPVGHG